jgi:hypothetical protein
LTVAEGVDPEIELAPPDELLARSEGRPHEAARVVDARAAGGQARARGAQQRLAELRRRRQRRRLQRRLRRLVGDAEITAVGALVTAARRIRRLVADVGGRQRAGIHRGDVAARAREDHGMLGRDGVPVQSVGMPPLGQARLVVAPTADPRARRLPGGALAHGLLERRDRPHAQRLAVDGALREAEAGQMRVGVDEARQERAAAQLDHARARAGERAYVRVAAHGKDAAVRHRHRRHHVVRRVDGVGPTADEDQLRPIAHIGR